MTQGPEYWSFRSSSYSINYKLISPLKWRVTETFSFLANCLTLTIGWSSVNWLMETNVFSIVWHPTIRDGLAEDQSWALQVVPKRVGGFSGEISGEPVTGWSQFAFMVYLSKTQELLSHVLLCFSRSLRTCRFCAWISLGVPSLWWRHCRAWGSTLPRVPLPLLWYFWHCSKGRGGAQVTIQPSFF